MKETTAEGRCGRERKKNRRAFWLTNQWSVLFLAPPPQSWDTDSALVLSNENVYETWEFVTVLWRSVIYFLFKTCNVINIICCAQKFSSLTNDTTRRDHASIRSVCVCDVSLRVMWGGNPVVRQRVVHVLRMHVVQCGIPDGVLLGEQVREELREDEKTETRWRNQTGVEGHT